MNTLANFYPSEGTTSSTVTITIPWKARKLIITNDTPGYDMEFKLNSSESYGTLQPTESLSMEVITNTVILNSPSSSEIAYRVWAWG